MPPASSFLNFVTDAFNSFSPEDDADARWETAKRLISEAGGTALNIGAIDLESDTPNWMLSSMSDAWLARYMDEKLYEIDPFIPFLKSTNKPFILDTTKTVAGQPLNADLLAAGYRFLYGQPFSGSRKDERAVVTYCTDMTYDEVLAGGYIDRIKMLSAILITQFISADTYRASDVILFDRRPLTQREKEVLSWLAHGLRNHQIAAKMVISEVTVRKHLNTARLKLGAMTREQALSRALQLHLIEL